MLSLSAGSDGLARKGEQPNEKYAEIIEILKIQNLGSRLAQFLPNRKLFSSKLQHKAKTQKFQTVIHHNVKATTVNLNPQQ